MIKLLRPKPKVGPIHLNTTSGNHPLAEEIDHEAPHPSNSTPPAHSNYSLLFDLGLARISILMEVVSELLAATATDWGAGTIFSQITGFAAGFSPAVQSVALGLYTRRGGTESGKLFGALSVVSSLWWVLLLLRVFGISRTY